MALTAAEVTSEHTAESFSRRVEERADSEARMFLNGLLEDNPVVTEMKELIEGVIAPEYAGRTVIELLQNGHDAHDKARSDGRLQIVLDESEGEHGTLYAVNGGAPLDDVGFRGMTGTGRSSKRPDGSIGNKGIGFKSVRELSDVPEVYSSSAEGVPGLTGYRFRFATTADLHGIARRVDPHRPGFDDELVAGVSPLRVPVPIEGALPDRVAQLADGSVSTVIRLPLRSGGALASARSQIHDIVDSEVPFHLFLERVEAICLVTHGGEEPHEVQLVRDEISLPGAAELSASGVFVRELRLGDDRRYVVVSLDVGETEFRAAITESCEEGLLHSTWRGWEGSARVSVAFPLHDPLEVGRFYTFLPMGESARAPLPAFVNAPFTSRADRRTLDESVPVNRVLLDAAAWICATMLVAGERGNLDLPAGVLVDAASWTLAPERLQSMLALLDRNLWTLPFVPALGGADDKISLDVATRWEHEGRVLTAHAVASTGIVDVVDPSLASSRVARLDQLGRLKGRSLEPRPEVLGACVEAVALKLAADGAKAAAWADFYDDLAGLHLGLDRLEGRRIVLDESGQVAVAGKSVGGPQVYFAPRQSDDEAGAVPLPAALRSRLVFASPDVPDRLEGRSPSLRAGREWLARQGLVSEYRTESVLTAVARTMEELARDPVTNDVALRECLSFAFELNRRGSREVSDQSLEGFGLLVPVAVGWVVASAARFGEGWSGPDDVVDSALTRLLAGAGDGAPGLAEHGKNLLRGPDQVTNPGCVEVDRAGLRQFLEAIGVRHGLWPVTSDKLPLSKRRSDFEYPRSAAIDEDLLDGFDADTWRSVAERWPGPVPSQHSTPYVTRGRWSLLPGQGEFESLDETGQRLYSELVVRGLGRWPDEAFEVRFGRTTDPLKGAWPTPLAAFLASAAWVPQTTPGDRATITRTVPRASWWLAEAETPDFLSSQPGPFRVVNIGAFLDRVRRLGVRVWDDPDTASERLDHLTELVVGGLHDQRTALSVRKAIETAWSELVSRNSGLDAPDRLVVRSQGELRVVGARSGNVAPIYVVDVDDPWRRSLLETSPLFVLPIRDVRLGEKLLKGLRLAGVDARSVAQVPMTVHVDETPVALAPRRPLVSEETGWLTNFSRVLLEFKHQTFPPLTPRAVAEALDRLGRVGLSVGREVSVSIGDFRIPSAVPMSLYLPDDGDGVVVVAGADAEDRWDVLEAGADSVAQALGAPALSDTVRVALGILRVTDLGDEAAAVARALRLDEDEVRAFLQHSRAGLDTSAVVFVLMCFAPEVGFALREAQAVPSDDAELREWLSQRLGGGEEQADQVLHLSASTDRGEILTKLGADLPTVNQHLRSAGLSGLENGAAQERQFRAYLQASGPAIRDLLRDRFVETARRGEDLSGYVELGGRVLEIDPDPSWVTDVWTLVTESMSARVVGWLDAEAPAAPVDAEVTDSVDVARADAQRSLRSVLGRLPALVEAWTFRVDPTRALSDLDVPSVVERLTATGRLDFGPLPPAEILQWLHADGWWPNDMPLAPTAGDLDLSLPELQEARDRIKARRASAEVARSTVTVQDETFGTEDDGLLRLFESVRHSVQDRILRTGPNPVDLSLVATEGTSRFRGADAPRSGWRAQRVPEEKAKLIGLIGESIVGRWIEEQFDLQPVDTWVSGYRQSIFADGKGDDRCGYDFQVETPDGTLLIEVKASLGDDTRFELGESEVRRAQNLADGEEYRIVFVTNADDPATACVHPLPNPFTAAGLQRYRIVGRSMSLRFGVEPDAGQ